MTTEMLCLACGHRFGRKAHGVLMFTDFVLCQPCSTSTQAHRKVFSGCALPHCTARKHSGDLVSIGRARQAIGHQPPFER
jgi:hypothetical protein